MFSSLRRRHEKLRALVSVVGAINTAPQYEEGRCGSAVHAEPADDRARLRYALRCPRACSSTCRKPTIQTTRGSGKVIAWQAQIAAAARTITQAPDDARHRSRFSMA